MFRTMIDAIRRAFAAQPHVFIVLISGMIGGVLAGPVQALFRTGGNLTIFAFPPLSFWQYALFAVFGALAAGFSIYMAANSRRDDLLHLFFFAMSCGIGFPAVLLDTQTKVAKETQQKIESVDTIVGDRKQPIDKVASAAAASVTTTVTQTPASEVDRQTRLIVADKASSIIEQLDSANTPTATAAAQQIFYAAREAGYTAVQAPSVAPPPAPAEAAPTNAN